MSNIKQASNVIGNFINNKLTRKQKILKGMQILKPFLDRSDYTDIGPLVGKGCSGFAFSLIDPDGYQCESVVLYINIMKQEQFNIWKLSADLGVSPSIIDKCILPISERKSIFIVITERMENELTIEDISDYLPDMVTHIKTLSDNGIYHGDMNNPKNWMINQERLYLIDYDFSVYWKSTLEIKNITDYFDDIYNSPKGPDIIRKAQLKVTNKLNNYMRKFIYLISLFEISTIKNDHSFMSQYFINFISDTDNYRGKKILIKLAKCIITMYKIYE